MTQEDIENKESCCDECGAKYCRKSTVELMFQRDPDVEEGYFLTDVCGNVAGVGMEVVTDIMNCASEINKKNAKAAMEKGEIQCSLKPMIAHLKKAGFEQVEIISH